jgi:MFS-type transporter involved in bile tolerance (Atg22 family)
MISTTFGSQRPAIISVAAFFLIGMIILSTVRGGEPNIKKWQKNI